MASAKEEEAADGEAMETGDETAAAENGRVGFCFSSKLSECTCDDDADDDARAETAAAAGLSAPLARISCRMCALTPVNGGGGGDATSEDAFSAAAAGDGAGDDAAAGVPWWA
jgi:hypothetical protein